MAHSTCKRTKQRSDCGRPSTVGERKNNQMASRCLTLFTALHGPQLRSFATHTERTKSWPLFGASSAAIRWREDRETIIVLQIRTPTFGFVQLLVCRFATRPLEGHRSSCSLEGLSALTPSTRLPKMTYPAASRRSDSGRLLLPQPPSEPLHRRLKEGDKPLKKKNINHQIIVSNCLNC